MVVESANNSPPKMRTKEPTKRAHPAAAASIFYGRKRIVFFVRVSLTHGIFAILYILTLQRVFLLYLEKPRIEHYNYKPKKNPSKR